MKSSSATPHRRTSFRCAKNAPTKVDTTIRDAYIAAFVSMGGERFDEAQEHIEKALQLAPDNKKLLEVRDLIEASMKHATKS